MTDDELIEQRRAWRLESPMIDMGSKIAIVRSGLERRGFITRSVPGTVLILACHRVGDVTVMTRVDCSTFDDRANIKEQSRRLDDLAERLKARSME